MKNKMVNNTSDHLVAASADSNTKFKWSDGLVEVKIYSKRSVILRQWWGSRMKISTKTNHGITWFLLIFSDIPRLTMTQILNIKYMSLSSDVYRFINVYIYCYHF